MPLEIERKFLLKNKDWKKQCDKGLALKQGYLNTNPDRTVRVRVKGDQGFLTIKGRTVNATRPEFEYPIPLADALQLLPLCNQPIIEKTRYLVKMDNLIWEIDQFEGDNEGLIVAEVELTSEDQKITIPSWIGEEVTTDIRYYNSNLALKPFCEWT